MGGNRGGGPGNGPRRDPGMAANRTNRGRRVPLWLMAEDKTLRPVVVRLGLTDGVSTQIVDGNLKPGEKIIVGVETDPNRPAASTTTRPPGFGGPMGGGFRR